MGIVLSYVYTLAAFVVVLLLGQGLLYVLSFGKHETNAVYKLLKLLTSPAVIPTRWITPKRIADRHVPVVTFFLLFWLCVFFAFYLPTIIKQ